MRRTGHLTRRYIANRLRERLYQFTHPNRPWLTPMACQILETLLRSDDVGLEFGSGRSTLWFAKVMRHLTSVDEVGGRGSGEEAEERMVRAFWDRVEEFRGALVSFNGRNFDLPVLELRALKYGCQAPRYFNGKFGHRHRYSEQGHYGLYDFLTNFGMARIRGGFHLLAQLVGLPGKGEVSGGDVQGLWEAGRHDDIANYCRRDVIQTYFLFLRVELMRGRLPVDRYERALEQARGFRRELDAAGSLP